MKRWFWVLSLFIVGLLSSYGFGYYLGYSRNNTQIDRLNKALINSQQETEKLRERKPEKAPITTPMS